MLPRRWPSLPAPRDAAITLGLGVAFSALTTFWVMQRVLPAWIVDDVALLPARAALSSETDDAPLADRVVLVVVDGLGFDAARNVDELDTLFQRGAVRRMRAPYPSFTRPAITAMVTGLDPRDSGVRLNGDGHGARGVEDVLSVAARFDVEVSVRSRTFSEFARDTRADAGHEVIGGRLAPHFDWAIERAQGERVAKPRRLTLIHFGEVDDAGHRDGRTSSEYRAEATRAASFLSQLLQHLNPSRDLLLAVSDHGHLARGGHGGSEPEATGALLFAWGARVRAGAALEERPLADVATTLTAALGLPPPATNLGAPMLDLFELEPREQARLARAPFDQASALSCEAMPTFSCARAAAVRASDARAPAPELAGLVHQLANEREQQHTQAERGAGWWRVALSSPALLTLTWLAARDADRRAARRVAWLSPLWLGGAFAGGLALLGYRPTLSTMTGTELFFGDAAKAGLLALLAHALLAKWWRLGPAESRVIVTASFVCLAPLAAFVGADPHALPANVPSALLFMLSPLVVVAALAGAASILLPTRA